MAKVSYDSTGAVYSTSKENGEKEFRMGMDLSSWSPEMIQEASFRGIYISASANCSGSTKGMGEEDRAGALQDMVRHMVENQTFKSPAAESAARMYEDGTLVAAIAEWKGFDEGEARKVYLKSIVYRGGAENLKAAQQRPLIEEILKKYDDLRFVYQRLKDEEAARREAAQDLDGVEEL